MVLLVIRSSVNMLHEDIYSTNEYLKLLLPQDFL